MDYFCNRVPCQSGQTNAISSLRGPVVGFCVRARAHTRLRTHVTLFHGKRSEECYNPDIACPSETSPPGWFQHTSRWHRWKTKSRHGAARAPSLRVALFNSRSARTPCVPQPLPSHVAVTVSYAAVLPLLASSAAAVRLSKPKTPRLIRDILPDWGLNKHSALWSGC